MSEKLAPQPQEAYTPTSVEEHLAEWAAQYTGRDAEAAAILAGNTIRLLGQASLSEQLVTAPTGPHPSASARSSKIEVSRPTWQESRGASQAAYITPWGGVYNGMEASSLRSFDERAQAAREQARQAQADHPSSSQAVKNNSAQGDSTPRISRRGSSLDSAAFVLGGATKRAQDLAGYDGRDESLKDWDYVDPLGTRRAAQANELTSNGFRLEPIEPQLVAGTSTSSKK